MGACEICSGSTTLAIDGVRDPVSNEEFVISFCAQCEIGLTEPRPDDMSRFYSGYYGGRHGRTAGFRAKRRLGIVRTGIGTVQKELSILDIGCGEGEFLEAAAELGWETAGVERTEAPASGKNVFPSIDEVKNRYPKGSFDVITLWHSLEHFRRPDLILNEAHRLLKNRGVLAIAVPNARGVQAMLFGKAWLHLDCPRHLYHLGVPGLEKLIRNSNFEVVRTRHMEFEYDLLGISQSALNMISGTQNVFFDSLRGKPKQAGGPMASVHFLGGLILSALAIPFVFLGAMLKRGGTIVVVAKKSEVNR